MEIKPDQFFPLGHISSPGGQPGPRDVWILRESAAPTKTEDFGDAIVTLLDRLLDRLERLSISEKLKALGLSHCAEIKIHGFCQDLRDANLSYTPERLRRLAILGVPLSEDFYECAE